MKPAHIYQVVLISITTAPVRNATKEISDNKNTFWVVKLMQACWNWFSMFYQLMSASTARDPDKFIWGTYTDKSDLSDDLTDIPARIKSGPFSNSHLFVSVLTLN